MKTPPVHDDVPTDSLNDAELLARETSELDDFKRLERMEPRFRDTTYGVVRGSAALVTSWERWWATNLAARMRGILTRTFSR